MHRIERLGRTRRMAAWVSLACLAAACGGGKDGPTGPGGGGNGAVAGDYVLIGAGGNVVPTVINNPVCGQTEIQDGTMTLGADGTYQMRFNWQDENGSNDAADHGTYRLHGSQLHFTSEAWDDEFDGQVAGGLLDLKWDFCFDNQGPELELTFTN